MILLAMHGEPECGKDAAYDFIKTWSREHGVLAARAGFADKMKLSGMRIALPNIELPQALEYANRLKVGGKVRFEIPYPDRAGSQIIEMTGREFWERYGTESHRLVFGDNFWVESLLGPGLEENFRVKAQYPQIAVITDCRFENEAIRVHDLEGEVWEIVRPGTSGKLDRKGHASRRRLPSHMIDLTIANDGTLDEFAEKLYLHLDIRVLPQLQGGNR